MTYIEAVNLMNRAAFHLGEQWLTSARYGKNAASIYEAQTIALRAAFNAEMLGRGYQDLTLPIDLKA